MAQKTFFFVGLENIMLLYIYIYMLKYFYMLDKSVANVDFEILSYTFIMKINMNESKYYMSA